MDRRLLPVLLGIILASALAGPAAAATPRIVGGGDAPITAHPYQVAVISTGVDPLDGFFCGGEVLDATHVATAAHCVIDDGAAAAAKPDDLEVVAGTATLSATDDPAHTHAVAVASFDPAYNGNTEVDDVAVLTLRSPLWTGTAPALDGTSTIAPIPLATVRPAAGTTVTSSGWGYDMFATGDARNPSGYPAGLRAADATVVDPATCQDAYADMTITAAMLCTTSAATGAQCDGDSGGPAVTGGDAAGAPAGERLAGLVNFGGAGCGQGDPPDVSAAAFDPSIAAFLTTADLPGAPQPGGDTTLRGTVAAEQTVTCVPGSWTGSPAFTYRFFTRTTGGTVALNAFSASPTLALTTAEVGERILCEARGTNAGGYGFGVSPTETVAAAPPVTTTTPPPTTTTPPPTTTTAPPTTTTTPPPTKTPGKPKTPVSTAKDTRRPTSGVASARCTRTGCVVNVRVTDPRPSAGIRTLRAVLTHSIVTRCGGNRHRHRHRCTVQRHRKLHAKRIGGGHWLVTATGLGPHTYTLVLLSVDKAGHVQRKATTVRLRPGHRG